MSSPPNGRGSTDVRPRVRAWIRARRKPHDEAKPVAGGNLLGLTASYIPEQHGVYADHLDRALADKSLLNIAVTGRYGAGKSSVLDETERRHASRVLRVSLSNLGAGEADETLTNRIEKEFVKQILHREPPHVVPLSRFRRISEQPWWHGLTQTAAILLLIVFTGWVLNEDVAIRTFSDDQPVAIDVALWAGLTGAITAIATLLRRAARDLYVSQFSAAGASLSLERKDTTYFDKYLEEVVYFFAQAEYDIVILEDLDRFNDPHIFQALRELNTILNASKDVVRPIRFVYAIRDSVFEKLGDPPPGRVSDAATGGSGTQAEATPDPGMWLAQLGDASGATGSRAEATSGADGEVVLANRTKFFDLVIPLVPFITHNNARDLFTNLMADAEVPVSGELIDLVARRLPDMRLLSNIRNEYSVFAHRLITRREGVSDLDPDKLFAMVAYKNVHLADFELILLGKGNLDHLDHARRELVSTAIASLQTRIRAINDGTTASNNLDTHLKSLREKLEWHATVIARASNQGTALTGYQVGSTRHPSAAAGTRTFWEALITNADVWYIVYSRYGNQQLVEMAPADVARIVGTQLDLDAWDTRTSQQRIRAKKALEGTLAKIRHADYLTLLDLPEFKLTAPDGAKHSFADLIRTLLGSPLAYDLVAGGHIDPFYGVYISQYYGGRVSANAMKFMMTNIGNDIIEANYSLDDDDVEALLRETAGSFLSDLSAYNTSILDHLLTHRPRGRTGALKDKDLAKVLMRYLFSRSTAAEKTFLNTYLADGTQTRALITYLAWNRENAFVFLIQEALLDDDARRDAVSTALLEADETMALDLSAEVVTYLHDNYASLDAVTTAQTDAGTQRVASILAAAQFVCEDLATVAQPLRTELVNAGRYVVTAANLRVGAGATTISLNDLCVANAKVYDRCIADPAAYLAAHADAVANGTDEHTVTDPSAFAAILDDIAGANAAAQTGADGDSDTAVVWTTGHIDTLLANAVPACQLEDITIVDNSMWPGLARHRRFDSNLLNVQAYVDALGGVDANLANLLTYAGAIDCATAPTEPADDETSSSLLNAKLAVIGAILRADKNLPDAETRTALVASMELGTFLTPESLPAEHGPMLGLVIARGICRDHEDTFTHFPCDDWETLHPGLVSSANIASFINQSFIDENAVARIFEDTTPAGPGAGIGDTVRDALLEDVTTYTPSSSGPALRAVGRYALRTSKGLPWAEVDRIAAATEDIEVTVGLLARLDKHEATTAQILQTLHRLGGDYIKLATPSQKFDVPADEAHRRVIDRLKEDGSVKSTRTGRVNHTRLHVTTRDE